MRYEIITAEDDRESAKPFNAAVFPIADDGESGDLVAAGFGTTPQTAVLDAVSHWARDESVEPEHKVKDIKVHKTTGEVKSKCCKARVVRKAEYTDTHVWDVTAQRNGAVVYQFATTHDGLDGEGSRFECIECGKQLVDPRLDHAEEG